MVDKSAEFSAFVEALEKQNNNDNCVDKEYKDQLSEMAFKASNMVYKFRARLNQQRLRMENWGRFQEAISQVMFCLSVGFFAWKSSAMG